MILLSLIDAHLVTHPPRRTIYSKKLLLAMLKIDFCPQFILDAVDN